MLSQLTLRFPKKLIENLKNRAATENTSVNALTERLVESSLKGSSVTDEYLRLTTDPDAAVRQLYRRIVLGETFGLPALTRAELKFILELSHQAYNRGPGMSQLVRLPVLRTLLEITFELLSWQAVNGLAIDGHYLKSTFGLTGEDWDTETARFLEDLPVAVNCARAELWLRPLTGYCFDLATFTDEALAGIFTVPRLKTVFPLLIHARAWDDAAQQVFIDELKPRVAAFTGRLTAGTVELGIQIDGQSAELRSAARYEPPRLFLTVSGPDFIMPFGWRHFSELLRALQVYQLEPALLPRGYHGYDVMFSPPGVAGDKGFIGLEALRVFTSRDTFDSLVSQLVSAGTQPGPLSCALDDLRCIYGDL
ncbi:transcriptional regulator [Kosakonia cowanii]|uniref:transcriptional regulator n=1 Tax=Kosakonia cowanii TaxID=208223 RepID=UPI003EE81102